MTFCVIFMALVCALTGDFSSDVRANNTPRPPGATLKCVVEAVSDGVEPQLQPTAGVAQRPAILPPPTDEHVELPTIPRPGALPRIDSARVLAPSDYATILSEIFDKIDSEGANDPAVINRYFPGVSSRPLLNIFRRGMTPEELFQQLHPELKEEYEGGDGYEAVLLPDRTPPNETVRPTPVPRPRRSED